MRTEDNSRLRSHPGWELLLEHTSAILGKSDAASLGSLTHSLGILQATPAALLPRLEQYAKDLVFTFDMASLSSCLAGFALHGYQPQRELLEDAELQFEHLLPGSSSEEVATVLHALSRLQHRPHASVLDTAAQHLADNLENFPLNKLPELTSTLLAFNCAKLPLFEAISRRAEKALFLAASNCRRAGYSRDMPFSGTATAAHAPRELVSVLAALHTWSSLGRQGK